MRAEAASAGLDRWPEGFAASEADRRAALGLLHLRCLTPRDLLGAAASRGRASAVLAAVREGRLGSPGDARLAEAFDERTAEAAVAACGARVVLAGDDEYPRVLTDLADPPLGLFVRGRPLEAARPAISIVGARHCTEYGREVARAMGRGLAAAGATVVSGAALGIDGAAHRGALDAPGPTVAVLGCGIDVTHPATHRSLLGAIAVEGSIVSEYPPGTPVEPRRFPARNRIIAALSLATVVVEGAGRSGSRITVDHAQECGRDVFAVPGPVTAPLSATPNDLIRTGAPLVRDAADVLAELGLGEGGAALAPPDLPEALERALGALGATAQSLESVAARAGAPLNEVLVQLLELELRGLVRRTGGRFERTLLAGR